MLSHTAERIANRGSQMQADLLRRTKHTGGKWRPDSWSTILNALKDEAQFAEECEPESSCAFVFMVEVAGQYLEDNIDPARADELIALLKRFTLSVATHAQMMDDSALTEQERVVMYLSLQGLHIFITRLHTIYPGAH